MNLTERDRKIVMGIIPVLLIVVYWFMLLSPKRQEASASAETLATEQARLDDAKSRQSTLSGAKDNFARDFATVVRLGKAIPTSVDMPSLLVQLEQAAEGTGIEFESVAVGERQAPEGTGAASTSGAAAPAPGGAPAAPAPGAAAPSGQPAQSGPGKAAGAAQNATDTANGSSQAAPSGSGATGGAPSLESVPLDFAFNGSFFELANLFHKLKRFVYVAGDQVRVRGRLLTIDSVEYTTDSFPILTAKAKATVYLTPKAEGLTAGASPSGPAPAAPTSPGTSNASSGGSAPAAPTATATP